jgi:hypothetical protein
MKMKVRIIAWILLSAFGITTNALSQWVLTKGPKALYGASSLAEHHKNLYAGGWYGGGVFISTDNGTNWTQINTGLTSDSVYALASNGTDLFAGSYFYGSFGGVCHLNSNDTSWTQVDSGIFGGYVRSLMVNGTNVFVAMSGRGVFLSTNNGTAWREVNTGLTDSNVLTLAANGSDIFAGTGNDGVFLSTNSGANWTAANNGLSGVTIYALAAMDANLFAGSYRKGVFLSTDKGTSWNSVNTGLTDSTIISFAVSGNTIFAGTNSSGVFLSTNRGTNWEEINTGLTDEHIYSLLVSGSFLFAGGQHGVWRRPLSDFGFNKVNNPSGPDLNIFISPNPTSGITTVYNSPANILHVAITNVLGEIVGEFVNSASAELTIDLSKLSPGTYFARFSLPNQFITRKIIKE